MKVYIINASGTFGGYPRNEYFFLVEANSPEEARNKTWKYVGLMSPFIVVDQQWSIALNVSSYPPLDTLNSIRLKAYYVREILDGVEVGEGCIVTEESYLQAKRSIGGMDDEVVVYALPKITDIIL
nr:hypothetical protein [uncultured Porphyromonas sp.]